MGKIAIYTRVSSVKQVGKDGDSLGSQKEKCEAFLSSQGYTREDFLYYEDAGISATSIENRDKLKEFLENIKSQREDDKDYIEGLCCVDLSRISRSMKHTIEIFKQLKDSNLKLYTIDGAFFGDLGSRNSKIMINIFGMLNELFVDQLREKVNAGMERSVQAGIYQGGIAPLGYKLEAFENDKGKIKKKLVIHDDEKRTVELIFKLFLEDKKSIAGVTKYLNEHGYPTKKGKQFKVRTVQQVLENPVYCGKLFWGKSKTIKFNEDTGVKEKEKTTIYDVDYTQLPIGIHEPIIDEDMFHRTLNRLKERKQVRKNLQMAKSRTGVKQAVYFDENKKIFSNILRCPGCGGVMTSSLQSGHKRKDGSISESKVYYKCSNYNSGRTKCDGYYSVQENKVFNYVKEHFFSKLQQAFDLIKNYESYIKDKKGQDIEILLNGEVEEVTDELKMVKKNREVLERKLDRVIEDQINIEDKASRKYKILQGKVQELEKQLNEVERKIDEYNDKILKANDKKEKLLAEYRNKKGYKNIEEYYNSLSLLQRRELLEQVYRIIIIDTISSAKKGPKRFSVKKVVMNGHFRPLALCKTMGIKDFEEFGEYLKSKGIELSIFDKHYPDSRQFFKELRESDYKNIGKMIEAIDEHIHTDEYLDKNGVDIDFTTEFIDDFIERYGDEYNEEIFEQEYIKAYKKFKKVR